VKPYYDDGRGIVIYLGDCREVMPELRGKGVDLLLTDPPFYLPAQIHAVRTSWPRSLSDLALMAGYYREVFSDIAALLRRTGAAYTFSDASSYAVFYSLLYPRFDRTQCIVWDKGVGGMGNGWRHSTEFIIHGAYSETVYTPGFRRDLLHCPTVPSVARDHPAEKPTALLSVLMRAHPEGVVLDPFMGVGSVLSTARALGRHAVGIEIDEAYCEIAARRLQQDVLDFGEVPA
jgi:site-specific DNA-methyltransferase (adenine-specific)